MAELRKRIKSSEDAQQERVNELNRQIKETGERQQRLLEAIEMGVIELARLRSAVPSKSRRHGKR